MAQAASLAADVRASYAKQPGEAVDTPEARVTLDVALRTASRGLGVAQGIHDRDYAAAGVSALGLAAVGRQATGAEPGRTLGLSDAANLADAALGYHQASRGEASGNAAVADAERALRVARYTGDPAAIRQAEVESLPGAPGPRGRPHGRHRRRGDAPGDGGGDREEAAGEPR